jgi:hypothetical protein
LFPVAAFGQKLAVTKWNERITLEQEPNVEEMLGPDPAVPEAIEDSVTFVGVLLSGRLTYGPPGPPNLTTYADGLRTARVGPAATNATTDGIVTFQFAVRQKSPPPVPVSAVDVDFIAHFITSIDGSAPCPECTLDADPTASAIFIVTTVEDTLVSRTVMSASVKGDQSDSLSETHSLPPNQFVTGSIHALSLVCMTQTAPTQWGNASATISTAFGISDGLIPGTSAKYSDYFEIEYGLNYFALGNPTPILSSTWGKMKSHYLNH